MDLPIFWLKMILGVGKKGLVKWVYVWIIGLLAGQEQKHDFYGAIVQCCDDGWRYWQRWFLWCYCPMQWWWLKILAAHAKFRIHVSMALISLLLMPFHSVCGSFLRNKKLWHELWWHEWVKIMVLFTDWLVPWFFFKFNLFIYQLMHWLLVLKTPPDIYTYIFLCTVLIS